MPSDRKKKKKEAARAKAASRGSKATELRSENETASSSSAAVAEDGATNGVDDVWAEAVGGGGGGGGDAAQEDMSDRCCTGVLESHVDSRDVHIGSLTLLFHGAELLQDATLELNFGRRYGLIGPNGCGKSTLLASLAAREVPIPEHIDIYFLDREAKASDLTALQEVMSADEERVRLEKEADYLSSLEMTPEVETRMHDVCERLDFLDSDTREARAASILHGLGFSKSMQKKKSREFSGGWRMRIALARALLIDPTCLLLDEPTNHLDLEACVWLEDYLRGFKRILLLVSHSQDFLNGVCTNIIHMHKKQLKTYTGNYDTYIQTRTELEENQMKRYKREQDEIQHMKEYIARFGHGSAKLARQAQSKEKTLAKMVRGGLTEKVENDKVVKLQFENVGKLPPPVLQFTEVAFGYSKDKILYRNVDFGVDLDSRIAIVGPNGAGKSTLLKLMVGTLEPVDGMVKRHNHLRIGQYHQHLAELLNPDLSPLNYMMKEFPGLPEEKMRAAVGRFGLTGTKQTHPIQQLSDGLKSRLVFAWLAFKKPHILLLDEPTNHLDLETIDSLAAAIKDWDGGMVLVSHDFRLISQVAEEIWEVGNSKVRRWEGDIVSYKTYLRSRHKQAA